MRNAFIESLFQEAKKDSSIVLITGDLGYGVIDKFAQELPNQFINTGITEQSMMGIAAGMASTGKRVFVYSIGNFPTMRCLEQIRNDVCFMNNPVVVVAVGAGFSYGSQGYTHHALEDIAVMRALPNMEVVSPADEFETKTLTKMLVKSRSPSYLRLGKDYIDEYEKGDQSIERGKVRELAFGKDGTILFTGGVRGLAFNARNLLISRGIEVSVCSVPFISDLDMEYLKLAARKGPIVTVEEHSVRGGFGSAILEALTQLNEFPRIKVIGVDQNDLSLIGDQSYLRKINGLNIDNIVLTFLALLEVKNTIVQNL